MAASSEPNNIASLLKKLRDISAKDIKTDESAKREALRLTENLAAQLRDPVDAANEVIYSPFIAMSARIAIDLDLFSIITASDKPMTPVDLAEKSGAEVQLVSRTLRLLSAKGFFHEANEELYSATALTKAMASSTMQSCYRFVWDISSHTALKAPKYFREMHHRTGTEPHDGLMQYAHGTKLPFFLYVATMPSTMRDFNTYMGNTMGNRPYWQDWYPVQESLLDGFRPDTVLLVDVGGGKGHDLESFHTRYPNSRGRLILQDLPHNVEAAQAVQASSSSKPTFECHPHDFFTPQPIKGARAYLLHHILHDWPDEKCVEILAQIKSAMTPGYSKMLIHELVLPNRGASSYQCTWDMVMMTVGWGMERSEREWRNMLRLAGFGDRNVRFLVKDSDADGLIEVRVGDEHLNAVSWH